jgi:hypothetical protein
MALTRRLAGRRTFPLEVVILVIPYALAGDAPAELRRRILRPTRIRNI